MIHFPSGATITTHPDEAAWHAYRSTRIGASDMAALFGASQYGSPYSVWCEKNPAIPTERGEANDAMRWGNWSERGIAHGYASLFGVTLYDLGRLTTVQHPTIPWLYATLDFAAIEADNSDLPTALITPLGCIEVKNVDVSKASEWTAGEIGGANDGAAPLQYQIQGQQQMAVTGLPWCDLFALIGGNRHCRVRMYRDDEFIAGLIERGNDMMRRIAENDPPDVDGHEATKAAQRMRWPKHADGAAVELPAEFADLLEERRVCVEKAKALEARKKAIEAKVIESIGDRQYGIVPGFGRVSSIAAYEAEVKAHTRHNKRSFSFPTEANPDKAEKMLAELRASDPRVICDAV